MEDLVKELTTVVAKSIVKSNTVLEKVQELENFGAPDEIIKVLLSEGADLVMTEAKDEIKDILEKYIK